MPDDRTISRRGKTASAANRRPPSTLTVVLPRRRKLALDADERVIGREEIADPTVSKKHLSIRWDGEAWIARDLGSKNGSWVDGEELEGEAAIALSPGSVLRLGDALLVLEQAGADGGDDLVSRDAVPGETPAMARLRAEIARAAPDPSPALVTGETGTGKELIARELHRLSRRAGAFVAVNCAAINAQLAESTLFGHAKGAFTGATDAQPGLFRAADRGTVFLDEVGELPVELQPKLLRALQEKEVQPVGVAKSVKVDVRVVAATNRELEPAVEAGGFRRDLFARLSLWTLRVPPLRERRSDLLLWVDRLDARHRAERGKGAPLVLDADAAEELLLYGWPENLRGVDRLVHELSSEAPRIVGLADLPAWLSRDRAGDGEAAAARPGVPSKEEFVAEYRKLDGSVRALAKRYGRDRRQIYRWIESHGLERKKA
jgi:transcriptional regulator with GAF, ATPase, and Fis domain